MKNLFKIFLIFLILKFSILLNSYSQNALTGRITDAVTGENLAFVNIVYNSKNLGTTTDIDGYFIIPDRNKIEFLRISSIGYETKFIVKEDIQHKSYIEIKLQGQALTLKEVTVLPGENPAHRIINLVIENSDKNNPEKVRSFTYTSYNKMYFTVDLSSVKQDTSSTKNNELNDSALMELSKFLDEQYLFLTESVTERRFLYPDNNREKVLAHRISGLQNPAFTLLTNQFQSFSFYKEFVSILDKRYLSPISKNSTRRYLFIIEDTLYNELKDTIFVISFRPRKDTNFDGLQGVLHINTKGYAIQSVIARPFEPDGFFNVNIQQKYELIDGVQWFPVQLNTDLIFNLLSLSSGSKSNNSLSFPVVGIGKSYIYDISLNPDIKRKEFNQLDVIVADDAHKKTEEFWNRYRKEMLTEKEIRTYRIIDSIGKEANLDKTMDIFDFLLSGYIPVSIFNIDLSSILWFNEYEKYRLGLGINTNKKLSRYFSIGGYFAYGFRDKAWKYGAFTDFFFNRSQTTRLRFSYKQDLVFSDEIFFSNALIGFAQQNLRDFFLSEMDSVKIYSADFKFNALKYLTAEIKISHIEKSFINLQRYDYINEIHKNTTFYEAGLYLRYAYKEKFLQTPRGNRLSLGTNYPILQINYIRGINVSNNYSQYNKAEINISKKFIWRTVGESLITLIGAFADKNTAYGSLYYGMGSYSWLNIYNSFNTMRVNEFVSDRFASVFLLHNFGSLLFKTKKWQPQIALFSAAGWGNNHLINSDIMKMNKGYFESGIILNNLVKINFQGFGVAVYYRYGPYSLPREIDNWAFKLSYNIIL
ncbi:MAG TPA: DUF5686 family protein [Bacteroidales bacterium]|jgi:hypothetical protein|nr:DUF5686 family protein [Bacteroidales bacterium]HOL98817.1 DUF5686 family protein [Bacteroidales bacterium]HOM37021.1 DUF5686 family protein [Bacteroidales bacterium]HPD24646.1 DUF5686 family protein [Bacteroidales bacterium]HRT00391.1 DUF5686 family protein [Bacteroidales bacterium]